MPFQQAILDGRVALAFSTAILLEYEEVLTLEKAVGTAKYADHAKTERIGEKDGFTQRENALFDSTPFRSRISRASRFELPFLGSKLRQNVVLAHALCPADGVEDRVKCPKAQRRMVRHR